MKKYFGLLLLLLVLSGATISLAQDVAPSAYLMYLRDGDLVLMKVDADEPATRSTYSPTYNRGFYVTWATWAPDGNEIFLIANCSLKRMDPDGTNLRAVLTKDPCVANALLSPGAKYIAYQVYNGNTDLVELWISTAYGLHSTQIARDVPACCMVWQDWKTLSYTVNSNLQNQGGFAIIDSEGVVNNAGPALDYNPVETPHWLRLPYWAGGLRTQSGSYDQTGRYYATTQKGPVMVNDLSKDLTYLFVFDTLRNLSEPIVDSHDESWRPGDQSQWTPWIVSVG